VPTLHANKAIMLEACSPQITLNKALVWIMVRDFQLSWVVCKWFSNVFFEQVVPTTEIQLQYVTCHIDVAVIYHIDVAEIQKWHWKWYEIIFFLFQIFL